MSLLSDIDGIPVIWNGPDCSGFVLILAHGAGAPMDTEFMDYFAYELSRLNIGVLRFEFPYMASRREGLSKRPPNPQKILLETWRNIISYCRKKYKSRIFIGGKSMGGRMASLIADESAVDGLICLGYPFYAPGKIDKPRTEHLRDLKTPTLVLQGERDPMGNREIVSDFALSSQIKLKWFSDGNHDLKPRKASGHPYQAHLDQAVKEIYLFITSFD